MWFWGNVGNTYIYLLSLYNKWKVIMNKSLASIAIVSLLSITDLYCGKCEPRKAHLASPIKNNKGRITIVPEAENSFDASKVSKMKSWKLGRERVALNAADWNPKRDAVRALAELKYYEPKKK